MYNGERKAIAILAGCILFWAMVPFVLAFGAAPQDEAVLVDPTTMTVSEPDGSSTFNIKLSSMPAQPVSIGLSTDNNECTTSTDSVTLNFLNWSIGANVTVTAARDDVIDGDQICIVVTENSSSFDPNFNNLDVADVTVTVLDIDVADIVVDPTSFSVSEPNGSDTFNIRLTSIPANDVTIGLSTSNSECSISTDTVVLNGGNWDTGVNVTVTAAQDDVIDGDQSCVVVTDNSSSPDPDYNNLEVANVTVTVQDVDAADIVVDPTNLTVSEPGTSDTFNISLTSNPKPSVTIGLSTSNNECSISTSSVTLNNTNWKNGLDVTVNAVDDDVIDGDQICTVQTAAAISDDPDYAGINPDNVRVTVQDDDTANVILTPKEVDVAEGGATDTYQAYLTSKPTDPVRVNITTDGQTTVSPDKLNFSTTNWANPQTVTVTAVDDDLVEGAHTGTISHRTSSDDGDYDGLRPPNVTANIQDNDSAAISADPLSLTVSEPNESKQFVVSLTSEPLFDVTITLTRSSTECTISPGVITLDDANWNVGESVTVTAADDLIHDGDQLCVVSSEPASSTDPDYNGLTMPDVTVTVRDNDGLVYLPFVAVDWPPIPEEPVLRPIGNPDGDGSYTVSWSPPAGATSYTLQEDTGSAFASPTEVYAGTATSHGVSGRGPTRYYYRVRAGNEWGEGQWSNPEAVDVLWELEPNDTPLTDANGALLPSLTYYGQFTTAETGRRSDYFYFDLASPSRVQLWLRNIAAGHNYDLVLRDLANLQDPAHNPEVGYSGNLGSADEYIQISDPLPAGRYWIQVYNRSNTASDQSYHLQFLLW